MKLHLKWDETHGEMRERESVRPSEQRAIDVAGLDPLSDIIGMTLTI